MITAVYYPPTQDGLQKTLDASLLTGVTASATLNNVTGLQNKKGLMVIDRVDGNNNLTPNKREYISFTGTSGVTTTTLVRGLAGSTDQDHAVGAIVEFVNDVVQQEALLTELEAINTAVTLRQVDGWIPAGTFTYASADAPTYVITVASGAASIYNVGDRIKLTDSTVKYFIITAVTDTTLTVYGGTDYTLTGGAITLPYYSHQKAPLGFPMNPVKWTVIVTDNSARTQSSPANGTWYNLGSNSIVIPIGIWNVDYTGIGLVNASSAEINFYTTLSTANNSESDNTFSGQLGGVNTILYSSFYKTKVLSLAAKTTYYFNMKTTSSAATSIQLANTNAPLVIRTVCAYL